MRPSGSGRAKGTPNRKSLLAEDLAHKLGVDPLEILLHFTKGDWKALGYKSEETAHYTSAGEEYGKLTIQPEVRVSAAKEAVKYIYSQKKAIELSNQVESEGFKIIVEDYTKK